MLVSGFNLWVVEECNPASESDSALVVLGSSPGVRTHKVLQADVSPLLVLRRAFGTH